MYKNELGVEPSQMQALKALAHFPWNIKPVYGLISDCLPIYGRHRKPYLLLSGAVGVVGWLVLTAAPLSTSLAATMLLFTNLSTAFADVIVDAMVAAKARQDSASGAGDLQSLCWGALGLGGIMGAAAGSQLLSAVSIRGAFAISAVAPLALMVNATLLGEPVRAQAHASLAMAKHKLSLLLTAIRAPAVWRPALWLFMAHAVVPSTGDIFFYFMTDEEQGLGFTPDFMSLTSVSDCDGFGTCVARARDTHACACKCVLASLCYGV
jgi:hypothetical protein